MIYLRTQLLLVLAMAGLLACSLNDVRAGVIEQNAGDDFLIVEAEDFEFLEDIAGSPDQGFVIITVDDPIITNFGSDALPSDSNASGGAAIMDQPGRADFSLIEQDAVWQLQFMVPGTYTLYAHYSMFKLGGGMYTAADSFFLPPDFDSPSEVGIPFHFDRKGVDDPSVDPTFWEGTFRWDERRAYDVTDAQIGQTLDFHTATREPGSTLDAYIFHLEPGLTDDELDEILESTVPLDALQAGDADQDLDFDQLDLVKVQVAAKYLSVQAATWGEGDWDGAPGGSQGSPPAGNGFFDQLDIISALASGHYLTGPYAGVAKGGTAGDGQTSVVYDAATGELSMDAPASTELTSVNIDSAAGIFTGEVAQNLGGSFDNDADNNVFKATFGSSFGSVSFGNVARAGLSEQFVLGDLTVVGSLAGGGDLGNVDLVYVPEPTSALILAIGLVIGLIWVRHARH